MNDILINDKFYSYRSIAAGKYTSTSGEENQVLSFIQQWMNGQQEFTIQTSGSTGIPKQLIISRKQMIISAKRTGDFLVLKKGDTALICLSAAYIAGKMMLVRTIELGLKATFISPCTDPFLKVEHPFDFTALVPLQVQEVLSKPVSKLLFQKTKNIIIGGAALSNKLENQLQDSSNNIFQTYGMTETVSHVALKNISKGEKIYEALPNISFSVDQRNCLIIADPTSSEITIQTNDIVDLVSTTSFVWKGRADYVINSGGVKIQTEVLEAEIQSIFTNNNLDCSFFIFSLKDELLGEKICLCTTYTNLPVEELLSKDLPKFHKPKAIFHLKEFSYLASGKLDRKACIQLINEQP